MATTACTSVQALKNRRLKIKIKLGSGLYTALMLQDYI